MASRAEPAEDALYWLALKLTPGLGARVAARLVSALGHPREIFHASPGVLESHDVQPVVARSLGQASTFEEAQRELERARQAKAEIITYAEARYPDLLRQVFDPPILLYARGNVELLARPSIAVVGARKPTPYGLAVAERLAADLATRGLTITSGLARGIDSAAHRGALGGADGGKTVAVLGCGIDKCYPSENRRLKAQIEEQGLVVSEFPMGGFAAPQNFPIRNRVISGLSLGVLVVEAAQYSGSLITARLALEQNREVFCVPGNITNKFSWGPNTLIKQGGKLVQEWRDVVDELPAAVRQTLSAPEAAAGGDGQGALFGNLSELEKALDQRIKVEEAIHIDQLLEAQAENSPSEILAALLELEIKGRIRQLPGKNYVKVI
jgi:DNA processing protein